MLVLSFPHFLLTTLKVDHYFAAIVGVILNTFIVVGLNLKRSNSLGTYRWFLMAHAGNDLLSAVTMGR
ncbi:hypothetical protein L596_010114 [Steinernema carpocapsae]|uniref:7TM GPCR serpentine receptor class x (Srx) domain-containing protein n=1 Tax=Steinernema carpocapsae TaxID=34508 RepID=A0A4U5PHU7_STECR|nr:hypothetical protein L596_010114 [Steinernema carpocapsae]